MYWLLFFQIFCFRAIKLQQASDKRKKKFCFPANKKLFFFFFFCKQKTFVFVVKLQPAFTTFAATSSTRAYPMNFFYTQGQFSKHSQKLNWPSYQTRSPIFYCFERRFLDGFSNHWCKMVGWGFGFLILKLVYSFNL